jgi:hypothetical protein
MVTGLLALLGYAYDPVIGLGLLMGGIGGVLAFWIEAIRIEKVASSGPKRVQSSVYGLTVVRLLIYGLVLYKAFTLKPDSLPLGLIGAVCGLFIVRVVCVVLGLTGLDLRKRED